MDETQKTLAAAGCLLSFLYLCTIIFYICIITIPIITIITIIKQFI